MKPGDCPNSLREAYVLKRRNLIIGLWGLLVFAAWTFGICLVDVRPIGPMGSTVGLAFFNGAFHRLTGVNWWLYTFTDWLSLIPLVFVASFGVQGFVQLIKRRSLWKVDRSLLALGGFYVVVFFLFFFFDKLAINYRPVLIEGLLEPSYPSSTTLLVMCVMPTAALQIGSQIKNTCLRKIILCAMVIFSCFMVIGRVLSGVHWITDIVGGLLLSFSLVCFYKYFQ